MDCCSTQAPTAAVVKDCPSCGQRGRRLKPVTLPALVREGVVRNGESYRFCKTV